MPILYKTYDSIDKKKWDDCIRAAANGLIYAESLYLDTMSANWDALVLDDYEAVMPLTWKKKWTIRYLYQPAFTQQGGVYSKNKITEKLLNSFLEKAIEHFRYAELTLNYLNTPKEKDGSFNTLMRNNFILQLGAGYKKIYALYDPYIIQRLNRLQKFSLEYKHSGDVKQAIELYRELYQSRIDSFSEKDYDQFLFLCKQYLKKGRVIVRHVYQDITAPPLAIVLLLKDNKRIYNIISCILPKGKKLLANYFLYDAVIREFADEDLILDFEGSDVPGISYFYNKFSGANQQYPFIKFNRLPAAVKLLKR